MANQGKLELEFFAAGEARAALGTSFGGKVRALSPMSLFQRVLDGS